MQNHTLLHKIPCLFVMLYFFVIAGGASAAAQSVTGAQSATGYKKTAVGIEIGGAPTVLLSDMSVGAFGFGLGYQMGVTAIFNNDKDLAYKARIEHVYLREESLGRSNTDHVYNNSFLKALHQEYTLIGGGVEFRSAGAGNQFFYEATGGWALPVSGGIETIPKHGSTQITGRTVEMRSFLYLGGGAGVRRKLTNDLFGVASARTFFVLGSPYLGVLQDRAYIPLPFLLTVSTEYQF